MTIEREPSDTLKQLERSRRGAMDGQQIIDEASARLGVEAPVPIFQGGQKIVLKAVLAGRQVIVKIVPLPPGPDAADDLERARREVE